jgi:hypothetical protein
MPGQAAMANADEAVPVISGRAAKMTKLETLCTSSDAAPPELRTDSEAPTLLSPGYR